MEPGAAVRRARVELGDHVREAGLGSQQHGRVAVDPVRVLRIDLHRHDRLALLERHAGDLADRHARHGDRLSLAREHARDGRDRSVEDVEVLPDERDPARPLDPLMGDDVGADAEAEDGHQHHQHDRVRLAADLPHVPAEDRLAVLHGMFLVGSFGSGGRGAFGREPSAGPIDAGPLTSGTGCL